MFKNYLWHNSKVISGSNCQGRANSNKKMLLLSALNSTLDVSVVHSANPCSVIRNVVAVLKTRSDSLISHVLQKTSTRKSAAKNIFQKEIKWFMFYFIVNSLWWMLELIREMLCSASYTGIRIFCGRVYLESRWWYIKPKYWMNKLSSK